MKVCTRALALLVIALPMTLHAAPEVVQLQTEGLNAIELEAFDPFLDSVVLSGVSEYAIKELYRGEFVAALYEAKPALLDIISTPFPLDEFVWVTSGELILTDVDGRSESYVAGDTLLVPKGWKGTWEMRGNYREFVVIETRANDSVDGFWKNIGLIIAGWFRDTPHVVPLPAEEFRRAELEPVQPTSADLKMTGGDPEAWKAVGSSS